jgi:hypothetical protein
MKIKSIIAFALGLATIGLALPSYAEDECEQFLKLNNDEQYYVEYKSSKDPNIVRSGYIKSFNTDTCNSPIKDITYCFRAAMFLSDYNKNPRKSNFTPTHITGRFEAHKRTFELTRHVPNTQITQKWDGTCDSNFKVTGYWRWDNESENYDTSFTIRKTGKPRPID